MNNFEKIFRLVQRTGEKCIFYDTSTDDHFVIMPLCEYERLIDEDNDIMDLTQAELLDKINRDIAMWKAAQEEETPDWLDDDFTNKNRVNIDDISDDKFYLEPLE